MAATAVDIGYGCSLTFQSGFVATIRSIAHADKGKRSVIDTSTMSSVNAWRTFVPGDLKDPGRITLDILFDTLKFAAWKTACAAAVESITITYPVPVGGTTAGTFVCSGFMENFSDAEPMDDVMTAQVTIKFNGEPTVTNGS